MRLIVCPAASLDDVCRARQPSHVVSFVAPGRDPPVRDSSIDSLVVVFNDIAGPHPGLVPPDRHSIARVLDFAATWPGERPMVLSCELGISRSPAAAFAIECRRWPERSEAPIAAALRAASPCATPNALMVALADDLLDRHGRMVAAVQALGRGANYQSYGWFELA